MISADTLVFIIAAFCQFKNPNVSKDYKLMCSEFMANCSIRQGGKTTNTVVDMCKENWAEKEIRN